MDAARGNDLGRISASEVVFRHGGDVVVSTLPAFKEEELTLQIEDKPVPEQIQIEGERFFASSVGLGPGMHSDLNLTVLKSYDGLRASLLRLKHLLIGLGLIAVLAGGGLAFVGSGKVTRPPANLVGGVRAGEPGGLAYPLGWSGGAGQGHGYRALCPVRGTP